MPREYDENGKLINISRQRLFCSPWEGSVVTDMGHKVDSDAMQIIGDLVDKYVNDVDLHDLELSLHQAVSCLISSARLQDGTDKLKVKNR